MIGIIGFGVLGKAMAKTIGGSFAIYDPAAGYPDESVLDSAQVIFICVPTPMDFTTGEVDLSCVMDAVGRIGSGKTVVIRSTVPPGTTDALQHERPDLSIHFVPEFLREKHAIYDAMYPTRIVVGSCAGRHNGQVVDIFERANPRVPIITTDARTAEMYKYACNCLLAFQIGAANEIKRISDALGVDYGLLRRWFKFDSRLGTMNQVPGHDGQRGFGGKCFPKDCAGLLAHSNAHGYDAPLLRAMIDFNNNIREVHDWLKIPGAVSGVAE
jgi:UDPglucose 6-dehydrogenase